MLKITKNIRRQLITYISLGYFLMCGMVVSQAQDMFGVTLSDYNGISSNMLNPALMTGSRSYVDINIVSADIFFDNSAFYMPSSFNWFPKFISGEYNFYEGQFKYGRSYNYYDNTNEKYLSASARAIGPSAMIQIGKHAFGITTSARAIQTGKRIPFEIPIIAYEEISYEKYHLIEFNDHDVNLRGMSWAEIGISYAYDLIDHLDNRLTLGVSIKGLLGMEAAYINARNVNYIIVDSETVNIINLDADFGFAIPIDAETNEADFDPLIKGFGVGADLGIVYTKKRSTINYKGERMICARPYQDYIFKIGASLLDFGSVNFSHNSELHEYKNVNRYWEQFDTLKFNSLHQAVQDISQGFYGDTSASLVSNKINIALPTAFSFQFDFHFEYNLYLGFVWQQPIKILSNTIWRPAQLALIPRYENRYIGVSIPVSVYNYSRFRVGLAVRFYSITVGTENIGSWFGANDFVGSNIYFSIKFNLDKGQCLSIKKGACYNQDSRK